MFDVTCQFWPDWFEFEKLEFAGNCVVGLETATILV